MSDEGEAAENDGTAQINAMPTKAFFVEMFTRDIPLEQAVLDLVDNSIDGARRLRDETGAALDARWIEIEMSRERFKIADNCGGFGRQAAIDYAFRFGRPRGADAVKHSIGRFGVGMKRALFKFGDHFTVQSVTVDEQWGVEVDVPTWEGVEGDWHFPWKADFNPETGIDSGTPGTEIVVDPLHYSVAQTFATKAFHRKIVDLIKTRHRAFVKDGVKIKVNDEQVQSVDIILLNGTRYQPSVWNKDYEDPIEHRPVVRTRVIAGLGSSTPREAGWYVICNGRIILYADRRDVTGWGAVEENAKTVVPAYHGQYARFRGIVSFECDDSRRLPWNTTKTDVDQDNPIWRDALSQMTDQMRPVIGFLNEVDDDIEEQGRDKSPLVRTLNEAMRVNFETLTTAATFDAPERQVLPPIERHIKVQYYKTEEDVEFMKEAMSLPSAAAVGSKCFDLIVQKQRR